MAAVLQAVGIRDLTATVLTDGENDEGHARPARPIAQNSSDEGALSTLAAAGARAAGLLDRGIP